jgi:hypothetical protein
MDDKWGLGTHLVHLHKRQAALNGQQHLHDSQGGVGRGVRLLGCDVHCIHDTTTSARRHDTTRHDDTTRQPPHDDTTRYDTTTSAGDASKVEFSGRRTPCVAAKTPQVLLPKKDPSPIVPPDGILLQDT